MTEEQQIGLIKRQQIYWNLKISNGNNIQRRTGTKWETRTQNTSMHVPLKEKGKNQTKQLTLENNQVISSPDDLDKAFLSYFQHIYNSSQPYWHDINDCLVNIKIKITNEMNLELTKQYTFDEVQVALS